jgi:papain like cysteine protease AvrRpt2
VTGNAPVPPSQTSPFRFKKSRGAVKPPAEKMLKVPALGGGSPLSPRKILPFHIQPQEEGNWCWAAVTASLTAYFAGLNPQGGIWKQCQVASQVFLGTNCCQSGNCDQESSLEVPMGKVGLPIQAYDGQLSYNAVANQIMTLRPVGLHISWGQGGAHFVLIIGYGLDNLGAQWVKIADPNGGMIYDLPFDTVAGAGSFVANVPDTTETDGTWDVSYEFMSVADADN